MSKEGQIHPDILFASELFRNVHYYKDASPDVVDIEQIMQPGIDYKLTHANCQVYANVTESMVHKLVIPPYFLSKEKFIENEAYTPIESLDLLQPGDTLFFGPAHDEADPADYHQGIFTGKYKNNQPLITHLPGHYKKAWKDGLPEQKIPGPRLWTPDQFTSKFREHIGYLKGIRRANPDELVKRGAVKIEN